MQPRRTGWILHELFSSGAPSLLFNSHKVARHLSRMAAFNVTLQPDKTAVGFKPNFRFEKPFLSRQRASNELLRWRKKKISEIYDIECCESSNKTASLAFPWNGISCWEVAGEDVHFWQVESLMKLANWRGDERRCWAAGRRKWWDWTSSLMLYSQQRARENRLASSG